MAKEYTLIGGNGTVVSPLEVTEDGDYVAGDSRAFNPVKVRTGGSSTLSGLTDVDISNPTDGQTLVYDAASRKWVNRSGGGEGVLVLSFDADTFLLDKTWQDIYDALAAGIPVFIKMIANNAWASVSIVHRASNDHGTYDVYANLDNTNVFATSDTADGYPEVID